MSQDRPFLWRSHRKQLVKAHKLSVAESQGISGWGTVITRLMETQIWSPLADTVGEVLKKKRTMASAHTFVWGKAALMPDTSKGTSYVPGGF